MPLRGWIVKPLRSATGERKLVAAMICQALKDARRGNREARDWLREAGPEWCALLGVNGEKLVTDWPEEPRPELSAEALRYRRRCERKRAAQAQGARRATEP